MNEQELIKALESVTRRREHRPSTQPLFVMDLPRKGWRVELSCLGEANWRFTVWELVGDGPASPDRREVFA